MADKDHSGLTNCKYVVEDGNGRTVVGGSRIPVCSDEGIQTERQSVGSSACSTRMPAIGRGNSTSTTTHTVDGSRPNTISGASTQTPRPARLSLGVGTGKEGFRRGSGLPRLTTTNTTLTTSIPCRIPAASSRQASSTGLKTGVDGTRKTGTVNSASAPRTNPKPERASVATRTNPAAPRPASFVVETDPEDRLRCRLASDGGRDGKVSTQPAVIVADDSAGPSPPVGTALEAPSNAKPPVEVPLGGGPKPRSRLVPPSNYTSSSGGSVGGGGPARTTAKVQNPGNVGNRRRSRLGSSGPNVGPEHRRSVKCSQVPSASDTDDQLEQNSESRQTSTKSPSSPESNPVLRPPRPPRLIPRRINTSDKPKGTSKPPNISPTRKRFNSSLSLSSRRPGRVSSEDDEGSQCTSPDAGLSSSTSVCGSEVSDTSAACSDLSVPSPVQLKENVLLDWDTDSYASTSVGASPDGFLDEYESDWRTDSFISQHADSGWYTDSCFSPNSPKETAYIDLRDLGSPSALGAGGEGYHQNLFLRLNSNSSVDSKRSSRVSLDSYKLPPSPEDENGVLRIDSEHLSMIYTDWANHYLEKARNKRVITDLQVDICDGVILAEVIEAVTNERIRDIKAKPRNSQQMVDNISQCLTFLAGLGVNVEGLSAKDIKDGNLKAILGLFFSLSRFKQQQKSAQQQLQHNLNQNTVTPTSDSGRSSTGSTSNANSNAEMLSRLPSPFNKPSSKCPTVTHPGVTRDAAASNQNLNKNRSSSSAAPAVVSSSERLRGPATSTSSQNNNNPPGGSSIQSSKAASRESVSTSRSTSPSSSVSNIPTPAGRASNLRAPSSLGDKHAVGGGRLASSTSTSSCASTASGASSSTKGSTASVPKPALGVGANNKNSMLDKFKFFKGDKKSGVPKSSSSKKSSSASGGGGGADKDGERPQPASPPAQETRTGLGTGSRIVQPSKSQNEPSGASGGSSPKLPVKSSTKKTFGLKKKETSVSKDDLNSKRAVPAPASANLQGAPQALNGLSSGGKRSSSSKSEKVEAGTSTQSSAPAAAAAGKNNSGGGSQNGGSSSPQTAKKASKIASLSGKSSGKTGKHATSGSNLIGPGPGSGIPAPTSGIPKPGSRSKHPKEDGGKSKTSSHPSGGSKERTLHNSGSLAVSSSGSGSQSKVGSSGRSESPKPVSKGSPHGEPAADTFPDQYDRSESSLRKTKGGSNQVQVEDLAQVQKHIKAAAMAAARSSPSQDLPGSRSSSTTHSAQKAPTELDQRKTGAGLAKPKPLKVDSDTQTHASAVAAAHARMRDVGKEKSNQSLSSEGSANVSSGENSKSSTSNSNNSVSSNDSVIFRPSSCDELESGMDSDTNLKPTDHISSLRQQSSPGSPCSQRREAAGAQTDGHPHSPATKKMETTFDTEGHTETRDIEQKPSKETTFGDEQQEEVIDIKPMPPIMRATPYAYLRSLTPGPLPRPSFHMSNTINPGMNSASSRLGVNRPLIDPHFSKLKRTVSNGHQSGDLEMNAQLVDGYMSDGDVLHSTSHTTEDNSGYFSDVNSGYMSEGGATLYAKKMQQRFREGMAAVKECMQKSAGLADDDRYVRHGLQYSSDHSGFDDSSSISSGEISDTINEISTDENLTGSSLSAGSEHTTNQYGSLKRTPQGHLSFSHQNKFGLLKSGSGLLDRSVNPGGGGGGGGRETGDFSLRKYFIGGDRIPSDARSDGSLERGHWSKDRGGGPHAIYRTVDIPPAGSLIRKTSQGTCIDPRTGQQWQHGTAYAVEDPSLKNSYADVNVGGTVKEKRDSETNTDHTLMLRKGQTGRPPQGAFGLRRPLSNVSTGSTSSSKSGGSIGGRQIGLKLTEKEKAQQKGERLANYTGSVRSVHKTASGTQTGGYASHRDPCTDMGPEAYSESTLERKKPSASLVTSKSQSTVSVNAGQAPALGGPDDYRSSTLGRKRPDMAIRERLFGSRSSLNGKAPASEAAQNIVNGTIISNPHATYSKQDSSPYRQNSFSGPSGTASTSPVGASHYVNITYLPSDYLNNRPASAMSNPTSPSTSPWIKSAPPSLHNGSMRGTLSETESMESISSSASSSIQAQIQQARAHGLLSRSILQHEKDIQTGQIQRSDSFRSTQSEKMFPSTSHPDGLQRTNSFSQISGHTPASPTPSNSSHASSRYTYPGMAPISPTSGAMSLTHATSTQSQSMPYGLGLPLSKITSKDEDLHGSALSLVSSSSSVYSTADERATAEILKLRRELESAQTKVSTLTNQLSTNMLLSPGPHHHGHHNSLAMYNLSQRAHVVAAFEQSLSNMTTRLQQLTTTAEQKDSELNELRATIEALKQQSGIQFSPEHSLSPGSHRRPSSSNTSTLSREASTPGEPPRMISRHMSSDSMSSINSLSSACSATSQQSSATDTDSAKKKKKGKSWLRSSFSKAFSRKKNKHGSVSDVEPDTASLRSDCSVPNSPLLQSHSNGATPSSSSLKGSHSSQALCDPVEHDKAVMQLQVALHEKDMKLTDIRLEALSSAHQLEQLRETMNRMKNEMASLKADNSRLQQLVSRKGLSHPERLSSGPTSPTALEKRLSLEAPTHLELLLNDNADKEGRRVTISVYMTSEVSKLSEAKPSEVLVGAISVSGKTKWEMLDVIVRRVFKEYVLRLDPVTNLGLTTESVNYYSIGDLVRSKEVSLPELLPCGYLVGDYTNITLTLKGTNEHSVESLAFETLIPKSIVQRYISLLLEHRRIILCGPSGTGKSYLAQKLAEYLVLKSGKELTAGLIATFNVDHKSSKELRQYLANIADQCDSTTAGELPSVIILDNLHHVTSLGEVFNGFLSVKYQKSPYIIGTMNQATCSTTNLQLHHNFRWVLCANHMEPVKGFLGRYLRRKLVEAEIQTRARNNDLAKIVDWMPKVWQHLNKFLETHSSSDVTIGPRLFLSCPMDVPGSQVWFTDLWNYSIVPYLLEAVREGLSVYGRRAPWEDPAEWVIETYPWPHTNDQDWPSLLRLRPEDVGYDSQGTTTTKEKVQGAGAQQGEADGDPLLNMLMRLQEAASYSSPQSADSDSTSLDSHSSGVQEFTSNTSGSGTNSNESTL